MGDMLQGGGNPWKGMIYGMTVRYPWSTEGAYCDPRDIWKIRDDFGIDNSKMAGYWNQDNVSHSTHPNVLAASYLKDDVVLVSIASWSEKPAFVELLIDWDKIGMSPDEVTIRAPEIIGFQEEKISKPKNLILMEPAKGCLFPIEKIK